MRHLVVSLFVFCVCSLITFAQEPLSAEIRVQADKPGITVSPALFGVFFEEINLSGDGGIYPELIRNRSFEFNKEKPEFWTPGTKGTARGTMKLEKHDAESKYNQTVLRVDYDCSGEDQSFFVINDGYWGVPVKKGETYQITVRAKPSDYFAKECSGLLFYIVTQGGMNFADYTEILPLDSGWQTYTVEIKATETDPHARFYIQPTIGKGTFWLDYVSLMPKNTYKGHGLRPDLMAKLDELKPAFVRFPGGCWVEGDTMNEASRWKRTIGNPIDRWTQWNIWGYQSTNGLGYHEYLQMCEDLHAEALFVINCGMSHKNHIPMAEMDEYVQDALDAIEYATGPVTSKWGKMRADNGHPEPFALEYIEVGNENGGPVYWERYDLFYTKIREKYPDIKIIANEWSGAKLNKTPIEIIDEHYYSNPSFFVQNAHRYDTYDRNGPKIYVGEYAVTQGSGHGNLDAAIGEAAFMTGMERNADVVHMSSYAPLFVNENHRRWNPDLICFDGTRSYGIPSYHVQKLFSVHRSDVVVPTTIEAEASAETFGGMVGVGSWETQVEYKDAKIEKDGKVLYQSDLAAAPQNAQQKTGDWVFKDGVLQQLSNRTDCRYLFGDKNWQDCTFSLKARKISGAEGFLILFNVKENDRWAWLNLGGWGNTGTALQTEAGGNAMGKRVDVKIETGQWYDVRIEQKGNIVKCYLDNKLILEDTLTLQKREPIYAVSGLNDKKNELIVKLVNVTSQPYESVITFDGITKFASTAQLIELTSENASDENSLDSPDYVSPIEQTIPMTAPILKRTLPAKSLTIIRVGVTPKTAQ